MITQIDMFTDNARKWNPPTSLWAGADVTRRARSQKIALLIHYTQAGLSGLTDDEAGIRSGLKAKGASYWRRCSDLRALGLIERTDNTRMSTAGQMQSVCVITDKGHEELEKIGRSEE